MLFGSKSQKPPSTPAPVGAISYDVNADDFEERVLKASMTTPVIVDFWAPWCGPCKQLMPVLEKVVSAANGEVLLAKVNIDENPELAQALRVQSVPTVFAFLGGRPVEAFQGAQPESQIKAIVDKLIQLARANKPDALNIPEALAGAAEAMAAGDLGTAQAIYAQILQQDEKNVEAYIGLVRLFIQGGALEQAQGLVENAPDDIAKHPNFAAAKTALDLAQKAPSGGFADLQKAVEKDPSDIQAKIDLAEALFASAAREDAIELLLTAIEQDLEWNEQAARKSLLKCFEAMGHADPLTVSARKKLSRLLFS